MSILRQFTYTADVKRSSFVSGKKDSSVAALIFDNVQCSPAYPVSAGSLTLEATIKSVVGIYDLYLVGELDVRQGDIVETDGKRYTVKSVGLWRTTRTKFTAIGMEIINQ